MTAIENCRTAALHRWGRALTHHPHVHMIVSGDVIALEGTRWISSRPAFRLFLTRLLIHILPRGFHRIRHYGLFASSIHKDAMALVRRLLDIAAPIVESEPDEPPDHRPLVTAPCADAASDARPETRAIVPG